MEKVSPSGQLRQRTETKPDGQHVQNYTPTGRVESEVVHRPDGSQQSKQFSANGRLTKEEVVSKDGALQSRTTYQTGRDGAARGNETVHYDNSGKAVSKTVVVNNTSIVKNTTVVNNTTIVNNNTTVIVQRNYVVGHYGYVYQPVLFRPYMVSWYDPYWYPVVGAAVVVHPFHFAWGWEAYPWYRCYHGPALYWNVYPVYPTPAYWMTDWMVASYMADHYAASVSAAQARHDAEAARQEAEQARQAAEKARDQTEIAEARAAKAAAEQRAAEAEARAARAERQEASAGQPRPNATRIDNESKEQLKAQVETVIAEKKAQADHPGNGAPPVLPQLANSLADPKHLYPVSKTTSVILAKDENPAGNITEGDLLKLEPGQESILKDAKEDTFVTMRVMSSKGEENEVTAGTLVKVPLRDVQEFDNEFRAKLDRGLAEADNNKEAFKKAN